MVTHIMVPFNSAAASGVFRSAQKIAGNLNARLLRSGPPKIWLSVTGRVGGRKLGRDDFLFFGGVYRMPETPRTATAFESSKMRLGMIEWGLRCCLWLAQTALSA
jgi:hypothetical protein